MTITLPDESVLNNLAKSLTQVSAPPVGNLRKCGAQID